MALADFQAGFWRAVVTRAECVVTLEELPSDLRARLDSALATFYGNNTGTIENATGIPGLKLDGAPVPSAFQAGYEFGLLVQRNHASAKSSDWGAQLANRLTSNATAQKRIRIRRDGTGAVVVEEL